MNGVLPNFEIANKGEISTAFRQNGIYTFETASTFIHHLRYGRNSNKHDLSSVFRDKCGTCSTKHAVLKTLANENGHPSIKLMLGILKMNATNTPEIAATLAKHQLDYIPEAHNYLSYQGQTFDFTKPNFEPAKDKNSLLQEIEIEVNQIVEFKIDYQKAYLKHWLTEHKHIPYSLDELWKIREQCIHDLS